MVQKIWETFQVLGPFLGLGLWTRACPLLHWYLFEGSIDKGLHKRGFPDPLPSNDEDITGGHLPPPPQSESHFSFASIILRTPVPTQAYTATRAHLWQTDGCSHTQSGHSPPAPRVPWSAQHRMIYIHLVIRKHLLLNFEGVPFRLFSHASSFDSSNILVLT